MQLFIWCLMCNWIQLIMCRVWPVSTDNTGIGWLIPIEGREYYIQLLLFKISSPWQSLFCYPVVSLRSHWAYIFSPKPCQLDFTSVRLSFLARTRLWLWLPRNIQTIHINPLQKRARLCWYSHVLNHKHVWLVFSTLPSDQTYWSTRGSSLGKLACLGVHVCLKTMSVI